MLDTFELLCLLFQLSNAILKDSSFSLASRRSNDAMSCNGKSGNVMSSIPSMLISRSSSFDKRVLTSLICCNISSDKRVNLASPLITIPNSLLEMTPIKNNQKKLDEYFFKGSLYRGEWSKAGQFFFFSHISQHNRPI